MSKSKIIPDEVLIAWDHVQDGFYGGYQSEDLKKWTREIFMAAKEDIKADKKALAKGAKLSYDRDNPGSGEALVNFIDKLGNEVNHEKGFTAEQKKALTENMLKDYVALKKELHNVRVLGVDNTWSEKFVKAAKMASKIIAGVVLNHLVLWLPINQGVSKGYDKEQFEIKDNKIVRATQNPEGDKEIDTSNRDKVGSVIRASEHLKDLTQNFQHALGGRSLEEDRRAFYSPDMNKELQEVKSRLAAATGNNKSETSLDTTQNLIRNHQAFKKGRTI